MEPIIPTLHNGYVPLRTRQLCLITKKSKNNPIETIFVPHTREFETNLRRQRQLEGIAEAKARGVYQGRKASIDTAKVKALRSQGMGASAIAKALKIGRASVYRALED
jgi:hypothetical protein